MRMNLKFPLRDLTRNPILSLLLILSFGSAMVMGGLLLENYERALRTDRFYRSIVNMEDLYEVVNSWTLSDNEALKKMDEGKPEGYRPYAAVFEDRLSLYGPERYGIEEIANYITIHFPVREVRENPDFKDTLAYMPQSDGMKANTQLLLGKAFGLSVSFPVAEGRSLVLEDYEGEVEGPLNVLAGWDYRSIFTLGEVLTLEIPAPYVEGKPPATEPLEVRIAGFLEKDLEILEELNQGRLLNADNKLIIPLRNDVEQNYLRVLKYSFLSLGSNYVITKDPKGAESRILAEAKKDGYEGKEAFIRLNPPKLEYKGYREQSNEKSLENYKDLFTGAVVISLAIAFLSISLLIRKNRRTYGVMMLSGGTRASITRLLALEIFLLLLAGWGGAIAYGSLALGGWPDIRVFLGYGSLVVVLSILASLLILRSKKVQYFIRFDEMSR